MRKAIKTSPTLTFRWSSSRRCRTSTATSLARAMELPDNDFKVVLDKATLDSILCGEGSTHNAQKMLSEISRVLWPDGVYIAVSHGQPSYRLTYLQRPEFGWTVKIFTVQKPMMGK